MQNILFHEDAFEKYGLPKETMSVEDVLSSYGFVLYMYPFPSGLLH